MSGTPPYVYQAFPDDLLSPEQNTLLYLYDANTLGFDVTNGADFFEPGCLFGRGTVIEELTYPVNSIDTDYPYCRIGVTLRMDDPRSDPLVAQLVATAPFMILKVTFSACEPSDIVTVTSLLEPLQRTPCGMVLYPSYALNEYLVVVDFADITTPARLTITVTNTKKMVKSFVFTVRNSRDGVAPGAVL